MIIQGDMSQCDKFKANGLTAYEKSGFYDAWFRLKGTKGVEHMAFSREDCIRHPLVKRILKTYEDEHEINLQEKIMKKFIEAMKRWIGLDKRYGDDRRVKKPRKRKNEKRKSQRRK